MTIRIESSQVSLTAQYSLLKGHSVEETLRLRLNPLTGATSQASLTSLFAGLRDTVQISDESRQSLKAWGPEKCKSVAPGMPDDIKLKLVLKLIEKLTGHKVKLISVKEMLDEPGGKRLADPFSAGAHGADAGRRLFTQFSVEYERIEQYREHEQVGFEARGVVETADGQRFEFAVTLQLSREFVTSQTLRLGMGAQPEDPLVVNFARPTAMLGAPGAAVDLNGDGHATERLTQLLAGSGYLVRDLDGDGRIDQGKELFGPSTGNGFMELAAHDSDGNGWIDSADPIYRELRLWSGAVNEAGTAQGLATLEACGVGAIWLQPISTPFELRDPEQNVLGQLRATGIFVGGNGRAGTVQQIDLVV